MKIIKAKDLQKDFFDYQEMKEIDAVKNIINKVKKQGDKAIIEYTEKFDKIKLKKFEVTKKEIQKAYKEVNKETISALKKAATNIKFFAKKQMKIIKPFEVKNKGIILGQKIVPIERVGCYVPGGLYPLPSTALMCIIPAKIAGVKEIIVCSPKIKSETIVAADIAGADRIFKVGGIQAIAGMTYGTESIPKVNKIVGPGNKFVTAAKKECYGIVGIDFLAGPSEVLIIADDSADSEILAADLLAQAEHDPNAKAILITTSKTIAKKTMQEVEKQLKELSTRETAKKSISQSTIILVDSIKQAIEISNKKAPEHLELQIESASKIIPKLTNYGSLFIGKYSAEVFGDYCSGTNHTLPTNGAAKYTGGLSVKDFVKILTYQNISKKASKKMIQIASAIAKTEGLEAHKKAAEKRKK